MPELHPAAAAHAALAEAVRDSKPLPGAHADICRVLDAHVRIAPDGTTSLVEIDGTPMLDGSTGFSDATVNTLMRRLRHDRPELFVEVKSKITTASTSTTNTGQVNATDLWVAAKSGDPLARQRLIDYLKV